MLGLEHDHSKIANLFTKSMLFLFLFSNNWILPHVLCREWCREDIYFMCKRIQKMYLVALFIALYIACYVHNTMWADMSWINQPRPAAYCSAAKRQYLQQGHQKHPLKASSVSCDSLALKSWLLALEAWRLVMSDHCYMEACTSQLLL